MGRTAGWLSLVAVFHSWKFATGFVLPPPPGTRTQGLDNHKNRLSTTTTTLLKASVVPSSSSPSSHQDGKDDTLHPPSWWTLSWFRTLEALGATEVPSAWHHATEAIACRLGSSGTEKAAADIVQDLANVQIPRRDGGTVLAYQTGDNGNNNGSNNRLVLLIHEFYGLSSSICQKADALAQELGCTVIAPDTFRGEYSTFIPYCLWLALATPQDRVNQDLDDVVTWWLEQQQQQSSSSSSSSSSDDAQKTATTTIHNQTTPIPRHSTTTTTTLAATIYQGQFRHHELHGYGSITYPDGSHFDGHFAHYRRHGYGTLYNATEQRRVQGWWRHNRLVQTVLLQHEAPSPTAAQEEESDDDENSEQISPPQEQEQQQEQHGDEL
mmetsp:Transcript_24599/g.68093  ORF Transcript_24599/g.68093 Transcript_24599/m.68093 type:complete len:381 (+) Transcript_24599:38-1180(+)